MKKLAIGIDIGGINTAFGLVDENGDLYADSVVSTKKFPLFTDYPAYVAELTESLHALADSLSFEYELVGIGIGGAQRQLPHGRDRTPGQPVEVPRRRNQSRREPPHVPAGGRHQEGVPGRRVPDDQRRQRRHDRRDDLRQRQGDEGFHHDHARDGTRFGIRRQWRDDLRPRRLRRRIRPRDRRAGRPPSAAADAAAVWKPTFRPPASSAPFSN